MKSRVGETILCKYLDNSLLEDSFSLNTYNNSLLEDSFSCQGQTGFDQEYISLSFDADLFSQKVEGYEATGVNAKRSRGTFAGVKGQVAMFLSLDACIFNTHFNIAL